jgi:hypothetical protein
MRQVVLIMIRAIPFFGINWGVASEVDRSLKKISEYVAEGNKGDQHTKSTNLRFIHRRIIVLGQQGTPEAASALMSVVLSPADAEYDEMPWFDSHWQIESTLGHTGDGIAYFAARELSRFPLTEKPVILSVPWVKVGLKQKRALKAYGAEYPAQLVANCRAWCEEVRDGKRTMKFAGDSREYNFQGKSLTSRSSSRRGGRREFQEGNPGSEFNSNDDEKVSWWIYLISGAFLIGSSGYWWFGRKKFD